MNGHSDEWGATDLCFKMFPSPSSLIGTLYGNKTGNGKMKITSSFRDFNSPEMLHYTSPNLTSTMLFTWTLKNQILYPTLPGPHNSNVFVCSIIGLSNLRLIVIHFKLAHLRILWMPIFSLLKQAYPGYIYIYTCLNKNHLLGGCNLYG